MRCDPFGRRALETAPGAPVPNAALMLETLLLSLVSAAGAEAVDFDTDVIPVFTRSGCNSGACHGSAAGRGGFKLSLLGGDPAVDLVRIVQELEGRRINTLRPEESLLLKKPGGALDHEGGLRLPPGGSGARILAEWIGAGAPRLRLRRLQGFELAPADQVAREVGEQVRFRALAHFDDGSERDVTAWTVFTTDDAASLPLSSKTPGEAAVLRPGQHTVLARYLDRVLPARVTLPVGSADAPLPEVPLPETPRNSAIDDAINERLALLRLPAAPPAGDAAFLRRARLTLTGTLPAIEETRSFLDDRDPRKRGRLIDRLLAAPEFDDYWAFWLSRLLRIRSLPNDNEVARAFHGWVKDRIREDAPFDGIARALITARGDSHRDGAAGFHRMAAGAREEAEYVSETFLGARLRCANCHNHPLDRWTQDDYHGLAAIFARVTRERVVGLKEAGEVTHPATGKPALPKLPGERFLPQNGDGLADLAAWLTSPENPSFARAAVNRLWQALMGRGLVEPADDLRATNPPTHPALLDRLAGEFVADGFRLRPTLRRIANSAAFARAAAGAESIPDDRFYSIRIAQTLSAEVLLDAIVQVAGVPESFDGSPPGTRAVTLPDPRLPSTALDILGRCSGEGSCEATAKSERGLAAMLHLLNGDLLNRKISSADGRLARAIGERRSNDSIVEEFYLRALCRPPSGEEMAYWRRSLGSPEGENGRREALEDFLWSLLTSREFIQVE